MKNAFFCGRKTVEKFSYCPLHLMIVYQPKGKKRGCGTKRRRCSKLFREKGKNSA